VRVNRDSEVVVGAIAPHSKTSPPNVSGLRAGSPERPTLRFLASDTG
jgi:hypothetical protein